MTLQETAAGTPRRAPKRSKGRTADALREISFELDVMKHAEGSCLARFGDTHVLCSASIEERVPGWLRGAGRGWVTAEYGMLPRATHTRNDREAARGKQGGRTLEIQRLIGRSLRAVTNLSALGERSIKIDCDVLQADGGTRTAAISGGYLALHLALHHMHRVGALATWPLAESVAAISCGLVDGAALLDLDYEEDSRAEADANFVMTAGGALSEVQAPAEGAPFPRAQLDALIDLAALGVARLSEIQADAIATLKS